jgi:uncharacterized protein YkwD
MTKPSVLRAFVLCSALGACLIAGGLAKPVPPKTEARFDAKTARQVLLDLINEQRARAGVPPVALDDTASRVGDGHAAELAENNFLSHWNQAGWLPYMRYGFAGGTDYNAENVSLLSGIHPAERGERLIDYLREMHNSMHDERPPRDGHRKTILNPTHTHVGFGIAADGEQVALSEEFLSRYVTFETLPKTFKRGEKFMLSGWVQEPSACKVYAIMVYYEPFPAPLTIAQLKKKYSYGFPEEERELRPHLDDGSTYSDRTKGEIKLGGNGRFLTQIEFWKPDPGVYTVVVYLTKSRIKNPFPATNVCLRVE